MAQRTIASRYRVAREVGRGGMATVYLALDEKHQREVALKVLRPDLAELVGTDRFLQEIEITARLNHPHILPLLDSGTEGGLVYYVMPYIAGGSLRLLMADAIPLAAVTRIAREVASALDHAHASGVIHRDIKPENVLFNDGLAVVSDFGIARAVGSATSRMTGTGLSVGTLGYMSPEQALGTEQLDARTDVYSLGCVLYEMVVGQTPASWPGAEDVELGRFADLPESHRQRLDRCPGRVEQVLVRALALRPQHRFPAAGELAAVLTTASEHTARFSDDEVRQLLRRAAQLQAAAPPAPGDLTIGAVEQIAAQVGIPPAHVRKAAREIEAAPPQQTRSTAWTPERASARRQELGRLGGDWRRLREEWNRLAARESVQGAVPESVFPAMVAEIQRTLEMVGHASVVGGNLTWSPATQGEDTRKVVVHVAPEGGGTSIRVQEELGIFGVRKFAPAVGALFGLAFGGTLAEAFAMGEPMGPLLLLTFGAVGGLTGVRSVVAVDATERAPQLEALARTLAELGREAVASRISLPGPGREQGH